MKSKDNVAINSRGAHKDFGLVSVVGVGGRGRRRSLKKSECLFLCEYFI